MSESVTVKRIGTDKVHLHQAITLPKDKYADEYVVVGFTDRGVKLNDTDFEGTEFTVTGTSWDERGYEPQTTPMGTPVFAY